MNNKIKFVFFGSSRFSEFVLEELEAIGFSPILKITDAKAPLPELPEADVFIVASFGKILPKEVIDSPKYGSFNVHPSLLPELRGPAPIQGTILGQSEPGATIIKMDAQMDHGPILAQEKVSITPWPDHYNTVEEKLGRAGGKLLTEILSKDWPWIETAQDDSKATYIKLIKTDDALINLDDSPEINLRKVFAYSTSPGAYFFHERKDGQKIRVRIIKAELENCDIENSLKIVPTESRGFSTEDVGKNCKLKILSVIPAGKKEMDWESFLRGNI